MWRSVPIFAPVHGCNVDWMYDVVAVVVAADVAVVVVLVAADED